MTGCLPLNGGCTERESTFDHDDKGNLTETVRQPGGQDLLLRTRTTYGAAGTIRQVTTSEGSGGTRTQRFGYNSDLLYPVTITDALGKTSNIGTHSGLGVTLEATDPNGVKTTMRYDRFGRLRETNHADGDFEHVAHFTFLGTQLVTTTHADGGSGRTQTDIFGRQVKQSMESFDGREASIATSYDQFDRVASVTRPSTSGTSTYKTTRRWDNRGRLALETAPDGATTRYLYNKLDTTIVDAKGVQTVSKANYQGEVGTRLEDDPASTGQLETKYTYGPFGELTKTVAPDGTSQTMEYDDLGRRVKHNDPDAGVTASAYNGFGELTSQTNGAGEKTTYTYDALGRMTRAVSPDGTATNTWDTAENGVGMLASAKSADGVVTRYGYDDFGHNVAATWTIDGGTYEVGYGYDGIGRQASITYPAVQGVQGRLQIEYAYNEHGYLTEVRNAADDKAYWTVEARNLDGMLLREKFGNGLGGVREYSPVTGLLKEVVVDGPGEGLMENTSYGYDPNGNITYVADGGHARQANFTYDTLNRLTGWRYRTDKEFNVAFSYDKIGNLTKESVDGEGGQTVTYGYGEGDDVPAHAMTSRNDAEYGYDAAGRQTSAPGRTIEYNTLGLPTLVAGGEAAQRTEFSYEAGGARVVKRSQGETVISVPGLFERRVSNGAVHTIHHIVADGRTVADVTKQQSSPTGPATTSVSYLHDDRQGSTILVTDADGKPQGGEEAAPGAMFYDPFGQRIDADYKPLEKARRDGPRQGYTGHKHDDDLGLVDMKGRVYNAEARRFVSPDPFVSDPLSSQSYNRFSYVRNNPATRTDPTGFEDEAPGGNPPPPPHTQPGEVIEVTGPELPPPPPPPPPFDIDSWLRGWGERPGAGFLRGLERNDPRLNPQLAEQLRGLRAQARQQVAGDGKALMKLNADQLAEVIGDLEARVNANGECTATSSMQCFVDKASLAQALALSKFRNSPELIDNGKGGFSLDTKYGHQVKADAAAFTGGAAALTGNIVSNLVFAATGNADAAKMFGDMFGGAGGAAKMRVNMDAFHADPLNNPLPVDHFGPVYDRHGN